MRARVAERLGLAGDALVGLPRPYPGPYVDAWMGLVRAQALVTATRIGVFEALPGTTAHLAAQTGTQPQRLEVLLEALRTTGYVRRRTTIWRPTRRTRGFLAPGAAMPLNATVGSLVHAVGGVLRGYEDVLRGADPPGLHDGEPDAETWRGYQAAMVELNAMASAPVLDALGTPRRLLDIGGGPGAFAEAACARWPDVEAVIADLPQAAALGRERIAAAGLAGRVRYVEGDARVTELGTGFDAVTLLQVLHNLDHETCVGLLRAAGAAAGPVGTVTILDLDGPATQVGALASVVFSAWMGSRVWTAAELTDMAGQSGLRDIRETRPAMLPGSVIVQARGT